MSTIAIVHSIIRCPGSEDASTGMGHVQPDLRSTDREIPGHAPPALRFQGRALSGLNEWNRVPPNRRAPHRASKGPAPPSRVPTVRRGRDLARKGSNAVSHALPPLQPMLLASNSRVDPNHALVGRQHLGEGMNNQAGVRAKCARCESASGRDADRRADLRVAEQNLDDADVDVPLQRIRRETVARIHRVHWRVR
jgi:hypothetical protein